MFLIYRVVCDISLKDYIGLTSRSFEERMNEHISESKNLNDNRHFHNAIRKYGIKNFSVEIIQEGISDLDQASFWEKYYIKKYDSFRNGYNGTLGGDGLQGFKHSEETKLEYSRKRKGNKYKLGIKENSNTKMKKSKRSKENNSTAKNINIFNSRGELEFECFSNFKAICEENGLPYTALYKSYRNNSTPILSGTKGYSSDYLERNKKFKNWFAKEMK